MDWTVWPLLLLILFMFASCEGCLVAHCTQNYANTLEAKKLRDAESSQLYCQILHDYDQCVQSSDKSCHADLSYRSALSILARYKEKYCSGSPSNPHPSRKSQSRTTSPRPTTSKAPLSCTYTGKKRFHHCGLFGDPHLKTFQGDYQTCLVQGAWPLISNPYLAVQVTNEPVREGSAATAPTKITVKIRGSSTACTKDKTYEAQSDSQGPLPATFIDGTNSSEISDSVVIKSYPDAQSRENHEKVEIYIRYIETTVVIRRNGKYLGFSVKIPQVVTETRDSQVEEIQDLCSKGCPENQRMNLIQDRGHFVSREEALAKCRSTNDLNNDLANTLTDNYLDWCIFDAMTAGTEDLDFVAAAHSAQADVLRLDPASLKNRTTLLETDNSVYSSAVPLLRIEFFTISVILSILHLLS